MLLLFYCVNVQGGLKFPLIYYKKKYILLLNIIGTVLRIVVVIIVLNVFNIYVSHGLPLI